MKPSKLVLLVEDNALCAKFFRLILEEALCVNVHWVMDADAALDFLSTTRPDLIHMDIQLPRMSGWETIERIVERPELDGIPICVVTACGLFYRDRYDALRERVAEARSKPIDPADYAKMVLRQLFPEIFPGDSQVATLLREWPGAGGRLVIH
jgi:CheY-like chemotaxis protein